MQRTKSKTAKPLIHGQWIEVTRRDGVTVTTKYPPNAEFERLRLKMDPPPDLIYRRIHFADGVPPEYMWTDPPESVRLFGGHFIHRLLPCDWPVVLQHERNDPHVVPGLGQERPEALGPCPCPRCKKHLEQALLESE